MVLAVEYELPFRIEPGPTCQGCDFLVTRFLGIRCCTKLRGPGPDSLRTALDDEH